MSKNLALVFCLAVSISSCKNYDEIPCVPNGLKENVRAFYSFNKGSLKDKSLEGNDLTINGFPIITKDRNGNIDCAFSFNRNTNDFLTADGDFLNDYHNKEFSVSLWYQPTDTISGPDYFNHDVLISRDSSYFEDCNARIGQWSMTLIDCGAPTLRINKLNVYFPLIDVDTILPIGCFSYAHEYAKTWHHLVGTYNKGEIHFYTNGNSSSELPISFPNCTSSKNFGKLFLGYRFTGNLDDIIIFNKELSASDVTQLYELEPCCE